MKWKISMHEHPKQMKERHWNTHQITAIIIIINDDKIENQPNCQWIMINEIIYFLKDEVDKKKKEQKDIVKINY